MYDKLNAPFKPTELDWRVQQSGIKNGKPWAMVLAYVDARACARRLDQVFGVTGWQTSYEHIVQQGNDGFVTGVKCRLSVWDDDKKQWVAKENGSPETDIESFKGGFSKAFVRVCADWGIGRYLYYLPTTFAGIVENGKHKDKVKDNDGKTIWFSWNEPELPKWALPKEEA